MKIIGVDVGGTFTDLILSDPETGRQVVHKVPSSPEAQDQAVARGIQEILKRENIDPSEIKLVVHGTTVATNAMLERKGARVCLITTRGFEDVLEIGRQNRENIYDICAQRPRPLVGRNNRYGIRERVDWKGEVIEKLDDAEVQSVVEELCAKKPDAIAISLLFSFRYPEHEAKIASNIRNTIPCYTVTSSEVLPEFREFERTSTTVLEAYLGPLVVGYLERLNKTVSLICPNSRLNVMQSNGGTVLGSQVAGRAVGLAISGLAGGAIGGWFVSKQNGVKRALTLDMGGTSCDVSAIIDGVAVRSDNEVAGLPLRFPSVDVKTIGAGGGSIAWLDVAGVLHVGPQSAGAFPGPAAYDNGGVQATVTDANLILGRLNPEYFVGGEIKLNMRMARMAVGRIADSLGISLQEAAAGIIKISTSNMVQAIREVTIERGLDPRTFVLVPFGGAGPTQAVDIAESLEIERILIPKHPGITSALGLVCADLRVDTMKSIILDASSENMPNVISTLEGLTRNSRRSLIEQGADNDQIIHTWKVDMRYKGQSHELTIELPFETSDLVMISRDSFEKEHERQFGYTLQDRDIEWVTARVVAEAIQAGFQEGLKDSSLGDESYSQREATLKSGEIIQVPVYHRDAIPQEKQLEGPLIVEQLDTTTWVNEDWLLEKKKSEVIWLRRRAT
ncbi:MAG: hydantoinase/oxoprolinase family protein [Candidatus Thorarchaeota archaeon]